MNIHKNARLTPQGRAEVVRRVTWSRPVGRAGRPGAGTPPRRPCGSGWRGRAAGEPLTDRVSRPQRSPQATPPAVVLRVKVLRQRERLTCGDRRRGRASVAPRSPGSCAAVAGRACTCSSCRRPRAATSGRGPASCCISTPRSSRRIVRPGPSGQRRSARYRRGAPAGSSPTWRSTITRASASARCCPMSAAAPRRLSAAHRAGPAPARGARRRRDDRQRLLLSLAPLRARPVAARPAPPLHAALHAAHQRQGRAFHQDRACSSGRTCACTGIPKSARRALARGSITTTGIGPTRAAGPAPDYPGRLPRTTS